MSCICHYVGSAHINVRPLLMLHQSIAVECYYRHVIQQCDRTGRLRSTPEIAIDTRGAGLIWPTQNFETSTKRDRIFCTNTT